MESGEYAVDEYKNDIHFILSPFSFCLSQGYFLGSIALLLGMMVLGVVFLIENCAIS